MVGKSAKQSLECHLHLPTLLWNFPRRGPSAFWTPPPAGVPHLPSGLYLRSTVPLAPCCPPSALPGDATLPEHLLTGPSASMLDLPPI